MLRPNTSAIITQRNCILSLTWADDAFGCPADAFNIWIGVSMTRGGGGSGSHTQHDVDNSCAGDEQSVTTMHKDHYENMSAFLH